ncbi:D-alanyl-D-alanine-carboxypeptidase/endopeptidase AmpH [Bordetella genomosp. 4]|uniref:D-alanyl-D-alanine- carboxypeptidase/endopeptidase AmpH n=1 Tax=Bordetella genomosp. 4 TaxID=463044 RepID=UPI000B9E770F|nr:D-alanyl-D-alanine-carboxypeptidase/endopeptidase AmpH [Bordetella genomosp. 4]
MRVQHPLAGMVSAVTPPTQSRLRALVCTLSLCCLPPVAHGADVALNEAASFAGAEIWLNANQPAMVIAVVKGDDVYVEGFGETRPGSGVEPDGDSIVRIGSLSKVLAGDVLAAMVVDKKVSLTSPLADFAPAGISIPVVDQRPVTLLDLATHSAGLPREMPDHASAPDENPYAVYSAQGYWNWFKTNKPAYRPGSVAMYSNFGFGLLGEALAKAGQAPYADLLKQYVTGPLNMADTVGRLSPQQQSRMLQGIDLDGTPAKPWETPPILDAGGGMHSTANDMVRWMKWHLSNAQSGSEARTLAHALYRPNDGLKSAVGVEADSADGMGLGWVVALPRENRPFVLGKSGGLVGFMSYVALSPQRDIGVFVSVGKVDFAMFEGMQHSVLNLITSLSPR